jgi:hypothetical protein
LTKPGDSTSLRRLFPIDEVNERYAILHKAQGEQFIARLAALISLLQIARAQD